MASTPLSPPIRGFFSRHELLPTNTKISSIRQDFRRDCPRCGASVETLIHALKDCQAAQAILTLGGLDGRLLNKDYSYYIDWIEDVMCFLDKKVVADFITMLWDSWNNQNNYVFRGKEEEAGQNSLLDFQIHNLVNKPVLPISPTLKKWEKPPCRTVKINFDVIVFTNKTCFGVIVRDSNVFVLGGGGGFKAEDMTAEWTKLYAFEEGLKIARSLNIANAIFETNCASLVNRVKNRKEDITIIGYRIKKTFKTMEMFTIVAVKWANRSCNKVVDFMCKYAIINNCNLVFGMDYPREIHDFVIGDSIN
ncbi:reverse transcriptase [Gossypium australe]|uniref:Reverse transcriptase n=1 Tax=Gossypium australe TaxID=47621 RepID=A0A5B6W6K1_9ROSI|nr:reverse transcriptase [Gossypium australe]